MGVSGSSGNKYRYPSMMWAWGGLELAALRLRHQTDLPAVVQHLGCLFLTQNLSFPSCNLHITGLTFKGSVRIIGIKMLKDPAHHGLHNNKFPMEREFRSIIME